MLTLSCVDFALLRTYPNRPSLSIKLFPTHNSRAEFNSIDLEPNLRQKQLRVNIVDTFFIYKKMKTGVDNAK